MRAKTCLLSTVVACLFVSLLVGCAHTPGGISDSTTPINGRSYTVLGRTSASDSNILLLGLIPITPHNSTSQCVREAIAKKGGDALIDVTVEGYAQWWILFIRFATKVEGTAIKFNN